MLSLFLLYPYYLLPSLFLSLVSLLLIQHVAGLAVAVAQII